MSACALSPQLPKRAEVGADSVCSRRHATHMAAYDSKQSTAAAFPAQAEVRAAQGVEPVLRTYNTLIIACNMCGQPREAMAVYKRMLDEGYSPNATTYNALISAYGKAGQLDKARAPSC